MTELTKEQLDAYLRAEDESDLYEDECNGAHPADLERKRAALRARQAPTA